MLSDYMVKNIYKISTWWNTNFQKVQMATDLIQRKMVYKSTEAPYTTAKECYFLK